MTPGRPRRGSRPRPPGGPTPPGPAPRLGADAEDWLLRAALALILIGAGLWLLTPRVPLPPPAPGPAPAPPGAEGYLFCTWNVENLFDDVDDPADRDEDEGWFGRHPEVVREKVGRLAAALRLQNGGRGPDILVAVEVETRRAAELLRDALNAGLSPQDRYTTLIHRDNRTGRRIEPAVLARLPGRDDLTRTFHTDRTLEAHLVGPGGAPLVVLASHWTSRLRGDTEGRRASYADTLYREVSRLTASDPSADILIAGDFNDEPGDPSLVAHLHTVADPSLVTSPLPGGRLRLLDLTARLDPGLGEGTYFYNGRWQVLDHIVASPGLLDPSGWRILPQTLRVENPVSLRFGRDGRPWRFGGPSSPSPRGVSDHFALTVRLALDAPGP